MGLIGKLKGELVDLIEWIDDSHSTLAWRFPRYTNEIKNGAQLIVREGQRAVIVYRGQLADTFDPGPHELTTENLPILSTLQGWKHGFKSPFRSEVYFINTRPVTDLRWGTPQPLTVHDPDFGMVQVRANGLCVVKIQDPEVFLREVIGTDSAVEAEEIAELLRRVIALAFNDMVLATRLGAIDLQGRQVELSDKLREFVDQRVDNEFGLSIHSVTMTISLPEEITQAMTRGVARGVEEKGYITNIGPVDRLQQVRAADAMLAAASNPGGSAMGDFLQVGMGVAMAGQMAGMMQGAMALGAGGQGTGGQGAPGGGAPPPLPPQTTFHVDTGRTAGRTVHAPAGTGGHRQRAGRSGDARVDAGDERLGTRQHGPRSQALFNTPRPCRPRCPGPLPRRCRRPMTEVPPPLPTPLVPPVSPVPPAPHERAVRHTTEETRTYPCASCGGQLEFGIKEQKLMCQHCGDVQEIIEHAGRVTAEQDYAAAVATLRDSAAVGPQLEGEKEVVCQSCGGHTTFTGTLTSARCPYCATPIQRDDVHDAPARLAVDGVLPFQVDERTARDSLEKWINGRWFAPNEFKKYKQTGSFASVYAAYFTHDADTDTWDQGRRGDDYTVTVGSGDNRRTETRTNWSYASGQVHNRFDDICVLANEGLDRDKVRKLEPWPTGQVRPFSAEYIAGHLCRTYDHDVEECFGEARKRMEGETTRPSGTTSAATARRSTARTPASTC